MDKIKEKLNRLKPSERIDFFNTYILGDNFSIKNFLLENKKIQKDFEDEFDDMGNHGKDGDWFKTKTSCIMGTVKNENINMLNKLLDYFEGVIENTVKNSNKAFVREYLGIYFQEVISDCTERSIVSENNEVFKTLLNKYGGVKSERGKINCVIHAIGWGKNEESLNILLDTLTPQEISKVGKMIFNNNSYVYSIAGSMRGREIKEQKLYKAFVNKYNKQVFLDIRNNGKINIRKFG